MESHEKHRPAFSDSDVPIIAYGRPFPEICRKYVDEDFKASRIYVLTSRTLANKTPAVKQLQEALGEKIVGVRIGMKPHTFIGEVLEVVQECRRLDADCIITLGAGSLTDAAKLAAFVSIFGLRNTI
jgi:alcohol dehydrogenase class IV